ncbi:glutamine synthetase family protein [Frigidibacter sp. SD6-1]|uniref:glutamine synthetase family protein n=1 Tax=Frigidibacter sp. SD6-1 TaxID=3032581 RepID=UPI0024DFE48F|nr:glutamine synthetase family protein [Frigidibacter sp. SD6-1]
MTELLTFVTTDYAGITRGRSIPAESFTPGRAKSVGWVPANMSLTPFDQIADPNPWGSSGDLRLLGDEGARYRVTLPGAATPTDMMMSDIVELDGTPWPLCPRTFLRSALAELKSLTGLTLQVSFEHEFQLFGTGWAQAPAFSLRALRQSDPFGPDLMAALDALGLKPEVFIAEYGRDQFEVTMAPTDGLAAADRAVVLREITRELASLRGWQASFAPKTAIEGVGNGVHIHFSFADDKGTNATFDAARPGRVSAVAGSFAAGIIRHLPALAAFTAPSAISYLRLRPHNWSSSYTWFGDRDREASLRICPVTTLGGTDPARAFNLEYRAADACACPHLALAVIVRAGIEGLKRRLPDPPLFSGDPETLPPAERAALGLERLPQSLEAALERFLGDPVATGWFAPLASETYVGMKRTEIALAGPSLDDDLCRRYAGIY